MINHAQSTRRDTRYRLASGAASVEFDAPPGGGARLRGSVIKVSVSGLLFGVDKSPQNLDVGAVLHCVEVQVGDCTIEGEVVVRDVRHVGPSGIEIGGILYPSSYEIEEKWMAVVAGIRAAGTR